MHPMKRSPEAVNTSTCPPKVIFNEAHGLLNAADKKVAPKLKDTNSLAPAAAITLPKLFTTVHE
jgi:hypothetical protein